MDAGYGALAAGNGNPAGALTDDGRMFTDPL